MSANGHKKKAVVIDDDEEFCTLVQHHLADAGFEVDFAYDGKSGIAKARELRPDLVVLDLMMPGMHGYEVCEQIRKEASLGKTRILVYSGKMFDSDIELAKQAGADDYLAKPFKGEAFVEKIQALTSLS